MIQNQGADGVRLPLDALGKNPLPASSTFCWLLAFRGVCPHHSGLCFCGHSVLSSLGRSSLSLSPIRTLVITSGPLGKPSWSPAPQDPQLNHTDKFFAPKHHLEIPEWVHAIFRGHESTEYGLRHGASQSAPTVFAKSGHFCTPLCNLCESRMDATKLLYTAVTGGYMSATPPVPTVGGFTLPRSHVPTALPASPRDLTHVRILRRWLLTPGTTVMLSSPGRTHFWSTPCKQRGVSREFRQVSRGRLASSMLRGTWSAEGGAHADVVQKITRDSSTFPNSIFTNFKGCLPTGCVNGVQK